MPRRRLPRLPRTDAFFGIHFDFHASDDCTQIAKTLTPAMIQAIIDRIRPDYIQCDCKGHRGLSSYPTRVGHRAPGFTKDPLKLWRKVTAQNGVALFMHYSGVWDKEAVHRHPDWAAVAADGKIDPDKTSVFGPYTDQLLIPQLLELARTYHVDGAWIDGDCWAMVLDYSPRALAEFTRQTGLTAIPRQPEDPHYQAFADFIREGFRQYLRHYLTVLKREAPNLQVTSNWAFSSHMPEPVSAPLEFLSGDYSLTDSYNAARLEARCLALQGKPWDLMAWGFAGLWDDPCRSTKSAVQLQQEAAAVLALGGGFQAYFKQNRDGSIQPWQMDIYAEVAKFCRARQGTCHKSTPVPQIALYYSREGYYRPNRRLFAPWDGALIPMAGVLQCLLDGQHVVDITMDHHLRERIAEYPLVIVPEWAHIADDIRQLMLDYVRAGGNLLLIGPDAMALFKEYLGLRWDKPEAPTPHWIEHAGILSGVLSRAIHGRLARGAKPFATLRLRNDKTGPSFPAASLRKLGRGTLAAIHFDFGKRYKDAATAGTRQFLADLVRQLFPTPLAQVTGSPHVDLTLQRQAGHLVLHLINTAGPHADLRTFVYDHVPPVGPLQVRLRLPKRPKRIIQEPAHRPIPFTWRAGQAHFTVDRLAIHEAFAVELPATPGELAYVNAQLDDMERHPGGNLTLAQFNAQVQNLKAKLKRVHRRKPAS